MDQLGENLDPNLVGRTREDENDSRSGSDNMENASGDDQDAAAPSNGSRPKKYHRHTPHQIQELESFFKDCPHPDEKQRLELSRRLGLEIKQIKFWFQNRRTQMKTQLERHENVILRQECDKLRAENDYLKHAMANPVCSNCGGPAVPGEISYDQHQLQMENARLREELDRVFALTSNFWDCPSSSSAGPIPSQGLNNNVELGVRRNGLGGLNNAGGSSSPMEFNFGDGAMLPRPMANDMPYDRSAVVDIALGALGELIKLAQVDSPFWIKGSDGSLETLNLEQYSRAFPSFIGMKPTGYQTEATRATGLVSLRGSALVEAVMDANRWVEMFPCLVYKAATIDVLSTGTGVTRDNALQVMDAEFHVLSPLAPARRQRFIRFCKQHSEGVWIMVDVSIDTTRDAADKYAFLNCRRLPSGFVIQDLDNKYSKITWIEHSEYDESAVHHLLRSSLNAGVGFGAHRWIATLQRQSECLAVLMSADIPSEDNIGITSAGRKSMLKLAQRLTRMFCEGVCVSSGTKWEKVTIGVVDEDMRVMSRTNANDPGEPFGVLLCAATSIWLPETQKRLYDFLRDERQRIQWDILSNTGPMNEMLKVSKGPGVGNAVSLLCGGPMTSNENAMLILQESWSDASGALVLYAPVDVSSMRTVMNGGDSAYVALLPSGFAILPCISPTYRTGQGNSSGHVVNSNMDGSINSNGCILTVGFQILVNSLPTAKLSSDSVETVNNVVVCTMKKVKAALMVGSRRRASSQERTDFLWSSGSGIDLDEL
ncbi:homeobox-leucine zipper protein ANTHOCYANINLESS 2-like [Hibiscus syriacus]|uniref:homeobox-leucine zipper protein ANTHOCYANINLESS 2-like n=1 Tax=Hibiscus syriacus TaxID=106335 RepID=UPI001920F420|nr:homeobox-leucine zipper protein ANTHOCYANINLESS 2-like [Hibiscus syriacus]